MNVGLSNSSEQPSRMSSVWFWGAVSFSAAVCCLALISIPPDPKNAFLLGYSKSRLLMIMALAAAGVGSSLIAAGTRKGWPWAARIDSAVRNLCTSFRFRVFFFGFCLMIWCSALFGLSQWYYRPQFESILLRLTPILLFCLMLSLSGMVYQAFVSSRKNRILFLRVWILTTILIMGGYFFIDQAGRHAFRVNRDPEFPVSDQSAYILQGRAVRNSNYQYLGDRNRTPLYPFLIATYANPDRSNQEIFSLGKSINIGLSLFFLVGLYVLFRRRLRFHSALNLALLAAFTLYVYRAGYLMVEPLYYTLFFVTFFLMLETLARPGILLAALTGLCAGITQLAKGSMLPGVLIFFAFLGAKILIAWMRARKENGNTTDGSIRRSILGLILAGICFLAVQAPYLIENRRVFGHYFYNVNSTFYIWYDSWQEAIQGTMAHGDGVGWPKLPPEQIPSFGKYIQSHTAGQIYSRFAKGFSTQTKNIVNSYSFLNYFLLLSSLLVVLIILQPSQLMGMLRRAPIPILFSISILGAYFLLYVFYAAIDTGPRFISALYLPYFYCIFSVIEDWAREHPRVSLAGRTLSNAWVLTGINSLLSLMVAVEIVYLGSGIIITTYFGF